MNPRTLTRKRIAVIGASAGIGRAFATRAGREGAHHYAVACEIN